MKRSPVLKKIEKTLKDARRRSATAIESINRERSNRDEKRALR